MRPQVTFAELHVVVIPKKRQLFYTFTKSVELQGTQSMLSEFHMYHGSCKRSVQTPKLVTSSLTLCLLRIPSTAAS